MANQRANIYPIQLQGAELNLNKFDGEIKQYSGFNKNNSPFVGGGLSPIFRKDETVEGATSKNTYIAPNGDVYRVTTEGLFKNDELVIDTSEADFFNMVDLGAEIFPESVVYVYDEETYIYIKDGKYYYHSGKVDYDFMSSYGEVIDVNAFTQTYYNIIKRTIDNIVYDIVGISTGQFITYVSIYKKSSDGTLSSVYKYKNTATGYVTHDDFIFKTQGNTINNFKLAVFRTRNSNGSNCYVLGFSSNQLVKIGNLDIKFLNGTVNNDTALKYAFTNKKAYYISTTSTGRVPLNIICDYTIDFDNLVIILNDPFIQSNEKYSPPESSYTLNTDFVKKYGACYGLLLRRRGTTSGNSFYIKSIDDMVTSYAYCDHTDNSNKVSCNMGHIVHGCVLLNGGVVSGLSLPGGFILVSEWNTVNEKLIFFGEDTDLWCENHFYYLWQNVNNKKWYKLVKSEPWLKKINNQIIINSNSVINSYDFIRNKKLEFAPAWNNRRPDYEYDEEFNITAAPWYYVTSINEYAPEDNSSIIINPVLVNTPYAGQAQIFKEVTKGVLDFNIYYGTAEIKYLFSFEVGKPVVYRSQNPELAGLPFPSNTDGNIQYSPSLFSTEEGRYGNLVFIQEGNTTYKLMTYNNKVLMSYFLTTAIEGLQYFFTIQGQLYGVIDNQLFTFSFQNEIANKGDFVVSVEGLKFCGNTPYQAFFFSKTNRCLYIFNGANVLQQSQFIDIYADIKFYKYNPATHSIFMVTDDCVLVFSSFGTFRLDVPNVEEIYLLENGIVLLNNVGTFIRIKYYNTENGYTKQNVILETCFYGMNNQTVTINDCLYMRLFSEEHESGNIEVSAVTLANEGKKTERTTFKIKPGDWDKETHSIYLRYQPKEQRGLGISFKINSPFKICSLSVGSIADSILIDKVSKGAINAPYNNKSSIEEW